MKHTLPVFDPITGKTDYHTADNANKSSEIAKKELVLSRKLNDGKVKEIYALPNLMKLNPMRTYNQKTQLKQRIANALVFVREGKAEQDIPVKLVA